MSETSQSISASANEAPTGPLASEIDCSCRLPLLVLFASASVWLVIASAFGLVASIKFHGPNFLANIPWLTYGRVRPAYTSSILYGFCLQAGLGTALWLLARLGRTRLSQPGLATFGAALWNLGVTVGVAGILVGDSTGFEHLEMPGYAALLVFLGYLPLGVSGALTFHQRRQRRLFASQWFLFVALFWFPWIYSTANLLLVTFPVRGITQAVIAWWYTDNLLAVWLTFVGLGAAFYFVPKLLDRELDSYYLALFAFWMLILFAGWGGIPSAAPVPAWMPTVSTVTTVLTIIPLIAVGLNIYRTVGRFRLIAPGDPMMSFVLFGCFGFMLAGFMTIAGVFFDTNQLLQFTWFTPARLHVHFYGFFAMLMFASIYYIVPQLTGTEFPYPKLVRAHFWSAAMGLVLVVFPFAFGGMVQALKMLNANVAFVDVMRSTLPFLRASTVGDLLLLVGHLLLLANVVALIVRFSRAPLTSAYAMVTADLFKTAEAKP